MSVTYPLFWQSVWLPRRAVLITVPFPWRAVLITTPLPWRSVWLPRLAVVVALLAGLPLYLQSPLWCDITLYDVAARNLLDGGTHYKDLFDTNLPGFVWLLTGLRWLFGNDAIVVRVADLVVVAGVVALIDRLAKWGGATRASRWWALAGVAFFYPFAVEIIHAQRDTWMALPALVAVALRLRRIIGAAESEPGPKPHSTRRAFLHSALEGAIWGLAVWLKPHIVFIALGTWFLTVRRLTSGHSRPWSAFAADLVGNLAGGMVVGLGGIGWMLWSKTWPHFVEMLTFWNPKYTELMIDELSKENFSIQRSPQLYWFPPWSLWLIPSIPLALLSIIDAKPWSRCRPNDTLRPGPVGRLLPWWLWDKQAGWNARFARGTLAGLYLVWVAQAFFIQRRLLYIHVPETLLMLGLWAAHRWAMPVIPLLWLTITSCLWLCADANPGFQARLLKFDKWTSGNERPERFIVRHPLADLDRMACWPECWRRDLSDREKYALWDRLKQVRDFEASICWEELYEVELFLRDKHVKDEQVIAWNDSPHAVYLMLGIKPGIKFMHVNTAQLIWSSMVQYELNRTKNTARYAVGDLKGAILRVRFEPPEDLLGPPHTPCDLLPRRFPERPRASFPFNQRAIFRTRNGLGRYTVHELRPPFKDISIYP